MLTPIQLIIAICFCINATLAVNFTIRFLSTKKAKTPFSRHVLCITISSAVWSAGMGLMSLQTSNHWAYIWREFGIFGTFAFMISIQRMICSISGLKKKTQRILNIISELGIIVFALYVRPGQTIFVHNSIGTTFYFKQGVINTIYSLYYTIVSINILIVTINTAKKNPLRQIRMAARRFIIVESLIFVGAITDMIMPSFGIVAFPGSALTHFWGVCVFWFAIQEMYGSFLTVDNMSQYIYYYLDTPVMVFNTEGKMEIANDSAVNFFSIDNSTFKPGTTDITSLLTGDREFWDFESSSNLVKSRAVSNNAPCEVAINKLQNKYGDSIGFIVLVNDLTEHEVIIEKLEQARLAADSANMSKSLFLANMSHEIRTPMNAILGFSQLALDEKDIDSHAKEYFSEIYHSGDLLLTIINEILDISKIELGKLELHPAPYKPEKLFSDTELIIRVAANKKELGFNMEIDPHIPKDLYGDKDKIREILINLLNNSIKYTKKGHVDFSARVIKNTGKIVVLEFKVTDTGIGIKPEDLPTIFDKFKRLDSGLNSTTEGTGLGLSITKGLIDLMQGVINVQSIENVGSTFTVMLTQKIVEAPVVEQSDSDTNANSKDLDATAGIVAKPLKVLVVDDNVINLKVTSAFLKSHGVPNDMAASGVAAIRLCKENSYDIVFMDQMMPEMDGVEAMQNIRQIPGYEQGSSQKIIALTANVISGVKEELMDKGFDSFLGKPMDFKEFLATMKEMLPIEKQLSIH